MQKYNFCTPCCKTFRSTEYEGSDPGRRRKVCDRTVRWQTLPKDPAVPSQVFPFGTPLVHFFFRQSPELSLSSGIPLPWDSFFQSQQIRKRFPGYVFRTVPETFRSAERIPAATFFLHRQNIAISTENGYGPCERDYKKYSVIKRS
jgi:hypothetical protein